MRSTKLLNSFFFLLLSPLIYGQDLIVKTNGDSLMGKIDKVERGHIHYTLLEDRTESPDSLHLSEVLYYQYNYKKVNSEKITAARTAKHGLMNQARYRIGGSIGAAYRTAQISDNVRDALEDYVKGLRWGLTYNLDFHYYFSNEFGIGLKYSGYQASNSTTNVVVVDSAKNVVEGASISDKIRIDFIGPSFSFRAVNKGNGNAFISNLFIGYMGYRNKSKVVEPFTIRSETIGYGIDASYDIRIKSNRYLSIQLSSYVGFLNDIEIEGQGRSRSEQLTEAEGLQRIELTIGIRFSE